MRQINLIDDRDDGQVLLHGQIEIGHRLGFDSLSSVDDQQGSLAGTHASRDFIGKIHVARGINKVELVSLTILGLVIHGHRMGLDGDSTFLFQIHGIQQLRLHIPI